MPTHKPATTMSKRRPTKSSKSSKPATPARKAAHRAPHDRIDVARRPNTSEKLGNIPVSLRQLRDVHPDTVDFRDLMYVPTLVEVPLRRTVEEYLSRFAEHPGQVSPVLDQGQEGACTGFGLAAVANYLLWVRQVFPDDRRVSARMLYEMARRYDEWPGEKYSGSSARGAMKGWHKHGVCSDTSWPYSVDESGGTLTPERAGDATRRPLGAYFRVDHANLVAMHSALAEAGILYATSSVHEGWGQVGADGSIPFRTEMLGGHAFAIVGYDEVGFWIQNSWGPDWGRGGFARIAYDDWLANGTDVWVARLGAPVTAVASRSGASLGQMARRSEFTFAELRPHVISIGNDGRLRPDGMFGTQPADVRTLVHRELPGLTKDWAKKRLLLYAHGGLVGEDAALQTVEKYRKPLLDAQVYPLAFVWKSDLLTTVKNILSDAMRLRRPEGLFDKIGDFLLDRLDDTLEPLARPLGKPIWSEMKENAELATTGAEGGARLVLEEIKKLRKADPTWEVHVAGHSAGSIFMGPVVQWLAQNGVPVASVTLWAPACTMAFFERCYLPGIQDRSIERFTLFTLKDAAEQDDDCAKIYNKSLLYLVSNALEEKSGLFFLDGEPLLGMETFLLEQRAVFGLPDEKTVQKKNLAKLPLFGLERATWIRSPNGLPEGSPDASHARHHGDFDDDKATVLATLARIVGKAPTV
jgi:hypothetical protein